MNGYMHAHARTYLQRPMLQQCATSMPWAAGLHVFTSGMFIPSSECGGQ